MENNLLPADSWLETYYDKEIFSGQFDHLKQIIDELDLVPNFEQKRIIIAGTNGKGQTSRKLNEYLVQDKQSCLLWTSPHLETVAERYIFNHSLIEQVELVEVFEWLKSHLAVKVSYYEFLFLALLRLNKVYRPKFLILEVGLGGRLDASNAIDSDIAVLTSISREHQDILGKTYKKILHEKLGVIRDKGVLFSSLESQYLRQLSFHKTKANQCSHYDLFDLDILKSTDHFSKRNSILAKYVFSFVTEQNFDPKEKIDIEFQANDYVREAMRGRLVKENQICELFPSHNPDGFRKLVQLLRSEDYTNYDNVVMAFSKRNTEDLQLMMKVILELFDRSKVKLCYFDHFKGLEKTEVERLTKEFKVEYIDYTKFFDGKSSKTLVLGSNYFLGELITLHKEFFRSR